MADIYTQDLVDHYSDREKDLQDLFRQQLEEEDYDYYVDFDDHSR